MRRKNIWLRAANSDGERPCTPCSYPASHPEADRTPHFMGSDFCHEQGCFPRLGAVLTYLTLHRGLNGLWTAQPPVTGLAQRQLRLQSPLSASPCAGFVQRGRVHTDSPWACRGAPALLSKAGSPAASTAGPPRPVCRGGAPGARGQQLPHPPALTCRVCPARALSWDPLSPQQAPQQTDPFLCHRDILFHMLY